MEDDDQRMAAFDSVKKKLIFDEDVMAATSMPSA